MEKEHHAGMVDMGQKADMMAQPLSEKKKHYPTLYLDNGQLPGLKDYDVGDEVMVVFHAKLTSKSKNEQAGKKEQESFTLELIQGKVEMM